MNRLWIFVLVFGLFLSGCCGPTAPQVQTLPTSFCYSLEMTDNQNACLEQAPYVEDDQRIRDYFTHMDTFGSDVERLGSIASEQSAILSRYNSATTYEEAKSAYNEYYYWTLDWINYVETTDIHLNNFENFLHGNKVYLDSQGLNTVYLLNGITTVRGDLKTSIYSIQANLENMGESLALEEKERERLDNLIDGLINLIPVVGHLVPG